MMTSIDGLKALRLVVGDVMHFHLYSSMVVSLRGNWGTVD